MNKMSQRFLDDYLKTLDEREKSRYQSFSSDYFCADEVNANLCADLILKGQKVATCSMMYWYEVEGEPLPSVGHLQVVTDWNHKPVCIIETTWVSECKFSNVTEAFAAKEGEGDLSLDWWRKAHWEFFSKECLEAGIQPTEDMLLVLEQFKVVYKGH